MQKTAEGLSATGKFEERFYTFFPAYRHNSDINLAFTEFEHPIDSAHADFRFAVKIFESICIQFDKYKKFIVLMGSDTLSYMSAALAYLLHDKKVSVIVTGAMQPLDSEDSDAYTNLKDAIGELTVSQVEGVDVVFGSKKIPATRCAKLFASVNEAMIDTRNPLLARIEKQGFKGLPAWRSDNLKDVDIRCLRAAPSLVTSALDALIDGKPDAVIIECYGSGTLPDVQSAFADAIRACQIKNVPVFAISQCLRTTIDFSTYASSEWLAREEVTPCADMHFSALYAKLWYLLSLGFKGRELKTLVATNICGEISSNSNSE